MNNPPLIITDYVKVNRVKEPSELPVCIPFNFQISSIKFYYAVVPTHPPTYNPNVKAVVEYTASSQPDFPWEHEPSGELFTNRPPPRTSHITTTEISLERMAGFRNIQEISANVKLNFQLDWLPFFGVRGVLSRIVNLEWWVDGKQERIIDYCRGIEAWVDWQEKSVWESGWIIDLRQDSLKPNSNWIMLTFSYRRP